ncbi:hypothetical protein K5N60_004414 [Vibrio parahaemolyticus]|nr:hypothetical protein [Vibrio parahaemolyticus]
MSSPKKVACSSVLTYIALTFLLPFIYSVPSWDLLHYGEQLGINQSTPFIERYGVNLYFSLIAVTTVGFGDISPKNGLGMVLVIGHVIVGITCFALTISAAWDMAKARMEKAQQEEIEKQLKEENYRKLKSRCAYLILVLNSFRYSIHVLLNDDKIEEVLISSELELSDFKYIFEDSFNIRHGFMGTTRFEQYVTELDKVLSEVKNIVSLHDLTDHRRFHKQLMYFLQRTDALDVREALNTIGKSNAKEIAIEMISNIGKVEDIHKYQGNVITPIVYLYFMVSYHIKFIEQISEFMGEES